MRSLQEALDSLEKKRFQGRFSINAYRDKVTSMDPVALLEYYGAENIVEMSSKYGTQYVHSCLIDRVDPHHTHGDKNPSASLQGEKLFYHCWSFGGGDLFWFLNLMEGGDQDSIREVLAELYSGDLQSRSDILNEVEEILKSRVEEDSIPKYSEKVLERYSYPHPALYEGRGIDPQVLLDYRVGFDVEKQEHIIPHFWKGDLVGWQRRRQDDPRWALSSSKSKYKNTSSFPKETTLYGFDYVEGESVLVVESVMSVLKARTYERVADDYTANILKSTVATFGAGMSQKQSEYLRSFRNVILWYDDDNAGDKATKKAVDLLEPFVNLYIVDSRGQKDDLAGLDLPEVVTSLGSVVPSFLAVRRR